MADYFYERLSPQDSSFLPYETRNTHMHITWTWIFESAPLTGSSGGIDIERIRTYIASRLHWIPRYRQRLDRIPIANDPIWVDDERFSINYHVRHTSLPQPGDDHQLKMMTARIMSQQLDRSRPLWEAWVIEGLQRDRFAIVSKTHHCMVDGVSTIDLMSVLLSRAPIETIDEAPRWAPRPAPGQAELLRDAMRRRALAPLEMARSVRNALREMRAAGSDLDEAFAAVWQNVRAGLSRAPATPLNVPIGPHRRVDWLTMDLDEFKAVKNSLGGTVNDVILATVAGAVRTFLRSRHIDTDDLDFRVVVPVSVRAPEERGTLGNRASAWVLSLPVQSSDARERYERVREETADLKETKQAAGADLMLHVADWAGSNLMALGVGVMNRLLRPYNLIVTNIPGSQEAFYLLGSEMLEAYPQVPLFANQGLGIAVSSYQGRLCWGCNSDWDSVPDLDYFVRTLARSFRELRDAAGVGKSPRKKSTARPKKAPVQDDKASPEDEAGATA
jgi:diacylglycerol O-acyltransferase / wax synthase